MEYILFTTDRCSKCPAIKELVKSTGIEVEILNNNSLNFFEKAIKLNVQNVPMLIALENGKEVFRSQEANEIKNFIDV